MEQRKLVFLQKGYSHVNGKLIYLFIYLFVYLFICLFIYLFSYLFICCNVICVTLPLKQELFQQSVKAIYTFLE